MTRVKARKEKKQCYLESFQPEKNGNGSWKWMKVFCWHLLVTVLTVLLQKRDICIKQALFEFLSCVDRRSWLVTATKNLWYPLLLYQHAGFWFLELRHDNYTLFIQSFLKHISRFSRQFHVLTTLLVKIWRSYLVQLFCSLKSLPLVVNVVAIVNIGTATMSWFHRFHRSVK